MSSNHRQLFELQALSQRLANALNAVGPDGAVINETDVVFLHHFVTVIQVINHKSDPP